MVKDTAANANAQHTRWALVSYSNSDEFLNDETPITKEQITEVRALFDHGDDKWMQCGCYPVAPGTWPRLQEILHCGPPQPGLSYFIEASPSADRAHR